MNIALDYDGTYTADPHAWDAFILSNNKVYIVTSRNKEDPVEDADWFKLIGVEVIYCNYFAKRDECEALGIHIDIWIDDKPYYIDHDYPEHEANNWRNNAN